MLGSLESKCLIIISLSTKFQAIIFHYINLLLMQPSFDAEYNQPDDGPSGENRVITPSLCPFNLSLKARVFTTFFIIVYLLNYIIIIKKTL